MTAKPRSNHLEEMDRIRQRICDAIWTASSSQSESGLSEALSGLSKSSRKVIAKNEAAIEAELGIWIGNLYELLDLLLVVHAGHIGFLMKGDPYLVNIPEFPLLPASAFHHVRVSLLAALTLTSHGMYSAARPVLRQAFEYLLLGKHYLLTADEGLLRDWWKGHQIDAVQNVIKKLNQRERKGLRRFWRDLCGFTHATRASLQLDLAWEPHALDIKLNLVFIRMLAECVHHLANACLVPRSVKGFLRRCLDEDEQRALDAQRNKLKSALADSRALLSPLARSTVYCYRLKWEIRSTN